MRVLVIGRGGREHAICWALQKSSQLTALFCAPGNGGIAEIATCVDIQELAFDDISHFALEHHIDLVVVGPDDPLSMGIVDHLQAKGIRAFGPNANAAIIESSKSFSKDLMKKYHIPTATYEVFDDYERALHYLNTCAIPIVIKADGLAAGKGVTVARSAEEARQVLHAIMVEQVFGVSGAIVVIEEFLTGQEMSLLAFVDGETVRVMVASQDHKPVYDHDLGPNTGGMGTYSPLPHIDQAIIDEAVRTVIIPTARAMVEEGRPFKGVLYAGLMLTEQGVKTIEFNARFGDPETQVILPRLQSDFLQLLNAVVDGTLHDQEMRWSEQAAVCVVLASEGYPGTYPKGIPIQGIDEVKHSMVFHAGTTWRDNQLVTNGGRVLGVVALGHDIAEARQIAYADVARITWQGMHYRTDIAMKALQ